MNDRMMTKAALIKRIHELESLNHQLMLEKERCKKSETKKRELVLELECKNQIITELSTIDYLTKISNRRAIEERLKAEITGAKLTKKSVFLLILDIDNFKQVNDSKGHLFGDDVLTVIATVIQNNIRDNDLAGRYGGDEFMVILSDITFQDAVKIAERIKQTVEQRCFDNALQITVSIGLKQFQGQCYLEFIQAADENLYRAKLAGKNTIVCA